MEEIKEHLPVIWENRKWFSIIKFDCVSIHLQPVKEGGGYFTHLPISPKEYRAKKEDSKACVALYKTDSYVHFIITDDWGEKRTMKIPVTMSVEIETAIKAALNQELLVKDRNVADILGKSLIEIS